MAVCITEDVSEVDTAAPVVKDEHRAQMALIRRAQSGDKSAAAILYERYVDTVFRFIYFRVRTVELAQDLTADTFVRSLAAKKYVYMGRDYGAWLVTIARNLIADYYKSSQYRMEVPTDSVPERSGDIQLESRPDEWALGRINNRALRDAIRSLKPEQKECIVRRFLLQESTAEVALAMGKDEGAVKSMQHRALGALARQLPTSIGAWL